MFSIFISASPEAKTPKYTMLITEYARIQAEWQPLREYYWFPVPVPAIRPGPRVVKRQPCPGCGARLTALNQREHECLGGRDPYPRLTQRRLRTRLAHDEQLMQEYIATRSHATVSTGENG